MLFHIFFHIKNIIGDKTIKIFSIIFISLFFISCLEDSSENSDNPGQISVTVVRPDIEHHKPPPQNKTPLDVNESKELDQNLNPSNGDKENEQSDGTTHSSDADEKKEQKIKYYLGSEGIVEIVVNYDTNPKISVPRRGFFVGPHTVVTNYQAVAHFKGRVSDNIFITHPETRERVPVKSIRALDLTNDLAVLHISKYESSFYYSEELFKSSKKYLSPSNAYIFNGRLELIPKLEGRLFPQNFSNVSFETFFSLYTLDDSDLSSFKLFNGSPVFSTDRKVIGVVQGSDWLFSSNMRVIFTDIQHVKKLLSRSSLNCVSDRCVKDVYNSIQSKEDQYVQGLVEEKNLKIIRENANQSQTEQFLSKINPYSWYGQSANRGYAPAMYKLAVGHQHSNEQMFHRWLERSAQNSYGVAQLEWGRLLLRAVLYESGSGDDFDRGIKWVQKVSAKGYFIYTPSFRQFLDNEFINGEEYLGYLRDFSSKGDPNFQYLLASQLLQDEYSVGSKEAIELLSKAAEVNLLLAVEELARIYEGGLYGEEQNSEKATNLKQKASDLRQAQLL